MPDANWKRAERRTAAILNGQRVSKHSQGEGGADVLAPGLAVEVKYTSRALPKYLADALLQARAGAKEGRVPAVVLRQKGKRGGVVVMDLEAFAAAWGELVSLREAMGR